MLVPGWKNEVCEGGSFCANRAGWHICWLLHTCCVFYGVTHSTPVLLCSTKTSLHVLEPAHHNASSKQSGSIWQRIEVNTNYGKNLAAHSAEGRINGKMHVESKLFPQGTLGGDGITHFKGKVPWIWEVTSLAFLCLLVLINFVLEKGISLSVLEILLIFKVGTCIPGCDQESYCSHHLS